VEKLNVDTFVLGGGIAGMQAALDLADQGYQVALVERKSSIGGKMITLSKVFPINPTRDRSNVSYRQRGFCSTAARKPASLSWTDCSSQ
jgi:heterodisulfide reductase subunit A-like polyferredoxin